MERTGPDTHPVGVPDIYRVVRRLRSGPYRDEHLAQHGPNLVRVIVFAPADPPPPAPPPVAAHPQIAPVVDSGVCDGRRYVVVRVADGPDLEERLATGGPIDLPTTVRMVGQVATGLDALHRVGRVHGSLTPADVLLDPRSGQAALVPPVTRPSDPAQLAPEQLTGAPVGPRTDVYALAALAYRSLTGRLVPGAADDPARVRLEAPPRAGELVPGLPAAVDEALAAGLRPDPAGRPASAPELASALAAGADRPRPGRPRRLLVSVGAVLLVAALIAAGIVVLPRLLAPLSDEDRARVPAALRDSCSGTAAEPDAPPGAVAVRCTDSGDREATLTLYPSSSLAEAAYRARVPAGEPASEDCADNPGSEHVYPGVGDVRGRVACPTGTPARIVWIDQGANLVGDATRPDGNALELYRAWSAWVEIPTYPVPAEQALLDRLDLDGCRRLPARALEGLDLVAAAVRCSRVAAGVDDVDYWEFRDPEALRRAYAGRLGAAGNPPEEFCGGPPARELAASTYSLTDALLGSLLCWTTGSRPTLTWTVDPLLLLGQGRGPDRTALFTWWSRHADLDGAAVEALNAQATPPFPTPDEQAVLDTVPGTSPICNRPSTDVQGNVLDGLPATGVACQIIDGPQVAYYFRLADIGQLGSYAGAGPGTLADCTTLPPDLFGSARYTRPDGSTGVLGCLTDEGADPYARIWWTDEQAGVIGYAYDRDAAALISWWQSAGGPN